MFGFISENIILSILLSYLCLISIFAVFVTVIDKRRAIKNKWRISESFLMLTALLGGSFAMYLTMHIIRHKTKHLKFTVGIPIIMILQVFLLSFVFARYIL